MKVMNKYIAEAPHAISTAALLTLVIAKGLEASANPILQRGHNLFGVIVLIAGIVAAFNWKTALVAPVDGNSVTPPPAPPEEPPKAA